MLVFWPIILTIFVIFDTFKFERLRERPAFPPSPLKAPLRLEPWKVVHPEQSKVGFVPLTDAR